MAEQQFKRDFDGRFICPHNPECRCTSTNCDPCGWNPEVFMQRINALGKQYNLPSHVVNMLLIHGKEA